ncbi:adhesin [Serratia liquefaciens]|uniref:MrpH family fimbial adhesin n=1 Tax=Serratia liquefaciens TaxID=614 RepID=UPI0038128860
MRAFLVLGFTLLIIAPFDSIGAIYSYIEKSTGSPTNADYEYVIASWDDDDLTPNPCFGVKTCAISGSHRHNAEGTAGVRFDGLSSSSEPGILYARTVGELGRIYKQRYPFPRIGKTHHGGPAVTQECVGIFYQNWAQDGAYRLMPGSVCGIAPPPIGICSIIDEHLILEHGVLSVSELSGNMSSGSLRVVCSMPTDVVLYIKTESNGLLYIDPKRTIYSKLKVNGMAGNSGYKFTAGSGGVSVPITSELNYVGSVEPGEFSSQTVAILALP